MQPAAAVVVGVAVDGSVVGGATVVVGAAVVVGAEVVGGDVVVGAGALVVVGDRKFVVDDPTALVEVEEAQAAKVSPAVTMIV